MLLEPPARYAERRSPIEPEYELGPDEIGALIARNEQAWVGYAHVLHAAALETIQAIDAKSVDGLSEAGATIDAGCEACHMQFWYPEPLR